MKKTATIVIRLTREMKDNLVLIAGECRRTIPDYIRLMFEEAIKTKQTL